MNDSDVIDRLEEIIETIKSGEREQAECDLADLYDEMMSEYDDYDEEEEDDEYEEDDEEYADSEDENN